MPFFSYVEQGSGPVYKLVGLFGRPYRTHYSQVFRSHPNSFRDWCGWWGTDGLRTVEGVERSRYEIRQTNLDVVLACIFNKGVRSLRIYSMRYLNICFCIIYVSDKRPDDGTSRRRRWSERIWSKWEIDWPRWRRLTCLGHWHIKSWHRIFRHLFCLVFFFFPFKLMAPMQVHPCSISWIICYGPYEETHSINWEPKFLIWRRY